MPLLKHAIKKAKQDKNRTARNRLKREHLRDSIKAVEDAAKEGSVATELLVAAQKMIDKCTKWNIIQANNAARKKSSLVKLAKGAGAKKAAQAAAKKTEKKTEETAAA